MIRCCNMEVIGELDQCKLKGMKWEKHVLNINPMEHRKFKLHRHRALLTGFCFIFKGRRRMSNSGRKK